MSLTVMVIVRTYDGGGGKAPERFPAPENI
jgi:hypothetical protein